MQLVLKKTSPYALFFSNKRKRLQIGFSLLLLVFLSQSTLQAQTINVTNVSVTPVCAGSDVTVTFTANNQTGNKYGDSTLYTVYLSNAAGTSFTQISGAFSKSVAYANGNGSTTGITQTVTIPAGTVSGTGYKIAVGSTGPTFDASAGAGASTNFSILGAVITGTAPASRNNPGPLALGATSSAGTINWYANLTGGTSLSTGTSYTTPSIATTITYYVDATVNGCTSSPRTAVTATINSPLSVTPSILDFGYVANGGISSSKSYTLSGQYLSGFPGNITVMAPANFQVSLSASSGFGSSVVVPYSSANLADTPIYVRFLPTGGSGAAYSGTVTISGAGGTVNVTVNGTSKTLCASSGNTSFQTGITSVDFNMISNTSTGTKTSGYADNTLQKTDVKPGSSYPLTVSLNTGGTGTVYANVFIDWNQDGDFDDANEINDLGSATTTTNSITTGSPKTITIPCDAVIGNTRMRVSVKYFSYPGSCDLGFDGEVEDYTLNIIQGATPAVTSELICAGAAASLSASGAVSGDRYRWYNASFGGTLLKTSADNSDNTYTSPVHVETAIYWVSILNAGGCESARIKATVTVNPVSVGGTAASSQTICSGTAPANITLSGQTGSVQWESSADNTTFSNITSATGNTLTAAQMGALTATHYYRAVVTSGVCTSSYSNTVTVTVNPVSVGGTASSSQNICSGTAPANITLSGQTGSIQWQSSVDNTTFINIASATGSTLTTAQMGTLTASSYYRAAVTSGVCTSAYSTTVTVTVNPVSAGGTASSNQNICSGTAPANITLSDQTGSVQWQSSADNITFTNIASATGNTLTAAQMGALTASRYYRAAVTSGVCTSAYSTTVTITVTLCINKWKGTISNDWNTPGNWSQNFVPTLDANIIFDDAPVNHCLLDQDRSVTDITNGQSIYGIVLNGKKLTLKGNLLFSGGATTDASALNSTMQFSGSAVQTINAGVFKNDAVYNLNINNPNNVLLNGNLRLLNNFVATAGLLDAFTNSPQITYAGNTLQSVASNQFLGEKVYNLTIDNAVGVNIDTNFAIANTLVINSGKKLSVSSLYQLTAFGTITNSAGTSGLILQSDAGGTASLMHNSNAVPATVQRYISGPIEGWHFLSSPVANQGIGGSWLPLGSYGTGNPATGTGYDLYLWDEPSFSFKYKLDATPIGWNSVHPGIDFSVGRGYLYSVQAVNPTKEFLGDLNNGPINYPVTSTITDPLDPDRAFNLVGNPYPSSVDWQAASGWDRTKLENSAGGHDMWVWNPTANNYGVFNSASGVGTNSINRYIAPMQGFFVKASGDGNLGFDNAVRVHTGAGNWFKNTGIKNGVFRLSVQSEEDAGADEALIQFGYSDNKQGASKLFSHVATAPSLYMSSNKEDYSVRYMTDTAENKSVPLEFKAGKDGFYNLAFNFDSKEFDFVQLEDRFSKITTAINPSTVYRFKALEKNGSSRFLLHFSEADTAIDQELAARVYMDGSQLAVDLRAVNEQTEVTVFDVSGRLLLRKNLDAAEVHKLNVNSATQILLVCLKNQKGIINTKVLYSPIK